MRSNISLPHGRLPDAVGAFLSGRRIEVDADAPDRGLVVLAGLLLGVVTFGAGCLTVVLGRAVTEA